MNNISATYATHFEKKISEHGESFKAIGFSSQSQRQRFEILSDIGNLRGKAILDIGCGFGDLYAYLTEDFRIRSYTGIDISLEMINIARKRYPGIPFFHDDILKFESKIRPDYSLASGIFFLHEPNWKERFIAICERLLDLSEIGVAVNLLSVFSPNYGINKESYYAEPWSVLNLVMDKLCAKIVLRHDYRINDFTIYMYK